MQQGVGDAPEPELRNHARHDGRRHDQPGSRRSRPGARSQRPRGRRRPVRARRLLARSSELHLEHPHDGRARRDRRDAALPAPAHRAARLDDHPRRGRRGRRRLPAGLDRLRDRNRPRARPHPRPRRKDLDAPDHAGRAQGPRGASRRHPAQGRRSRRDRVAQELGRAPRRRAGEPRSRGAARGGHHRWRPGRDRARRAAASARRADHHRRAQRPSRRQLAQAVQVALPARPGVVRPPALHPVPRELAGLLAQGQDRRLARDVYPRDGAQLLDLDHRRAGELGRHREGMAGPRPPRRRGDHPAPEAARPRHRHVGQAERPGLPGPGRLRGRAAPFLAAPGAGRLQGPEGRRHRLQQLGARHCRRALGGRRRRDDGAAVEHAHRPLRALDAHRPGGALLRGGRRGRHDHG